MKKLKHKCDIGWCKNKAKHYYHKGAYMGYYYTELSHKDILYKRVEWLKLCDYHDKIIFKNGG